MEFDTILRAKEFSCNMPDVAIVLSDGVSQARVAISIDGIAVLEEQMFGVKTDVDGTVRYVITLQDMSELVTPYARRRHTVRLEVSATEEGQTAQTLECDVVYCQAEFTDMTPADFLSRYFMSILMGTKQTALGRMELLHMQGDDTPACTATYSDGTTQAFPVSVVQEGSGYKTLDVSPGLFQSPGKTLISYSVTAGSRRQDYELDLRQPDCAPIVVFTNSFGLDELAYCTGLHKVDPSYARSMAYVGHTQRNYRIDETRQFKADTGPLTMPMANWWDDVFRSQSVRIVNFHEGHPNVGKDLVITDSKSEYTNDDAELPRFTFTYQYAQRNHNVVQMLRAGRIFDNTFDNTFN